LYADQIDGTVGRELARESGLALLVQWNNVVLGFAMEVLYG